MICERVHLCRTGRWRKPPGEVAALPASREALPADALFLPLEENEAVFDASSILPNPVQACIHESCGSTSSVAVRVGAALLPVAGSSASASEVRWRRPHDGVVPGHNAGSQQDMAIARLVSRCGASCERLVPSSVVTLRSGLQIPVIGLGTRQLKSGTECQGVVRVALRSGYRLIDTAATYGNEEDIGRGVRAAGHRREDVFLVTKLAPSEHGDVEHVRQALQASLTRLGTTYVDLFLVHSPKGGRVIQTWNAMLEMKACGLARAVGVSNFGIAQLEGLAASSCEMPEVNQVELHFGFQQRSLSSYCSHAKIAVMAASPLARGRLFGGRTALNVIAARHGRTEAELAVRWCLQRGYIAIPKTRDLKRVEANAPFGFSLGNTDMADIDTLDCGFISSATTKSMDLPWEAVIMEVSEVTEDDGEGGRGERQRRRKRRTGKGKGKGNAKAMEMPAAGVCGKGSNEGSSTASRWSDMLTSLT